jgi:hypothetical protein
MASAIAALDHSSASPGVRARDALTVRGEWSGKNQSRNIMSSQIAACLSIRFAAMVMPNGIPPAEAIFPIDAASYFLASHMGAMHT